MKPHKTEEELIIEVKDIAKKLGRIPTIPDFLRIGGKNPTTQIRRFGSWNNFLKTTFGKVVQVSPQPPQIVQCKYCDKKFAKRACQIKKTINHFCCKSCAVTYNNLHKKSGTRSSKLEKWLAVQLIKKYPTLTFIFNDKSAIDSELDIFIPALSLAFELNGIFHYEPIYGNNKLNQITTNDKKKFKLCIEKNINLCVIDVSSLKYFKPENAIKYLDIISSIIEECAIISSSGGIGIP